MVSFMMLVLIFILKFNNVVQRNIQTDRPYSVVYKVNYSQLELSNNNNSTVICVPSYLPDNGTFLEDSSVLLTPT